MVAPVLISTISVSSTLTSVQHETFRPYLSPPSPYDTTCPTRHPQPPHGSRGCSCFPLICAHGARKQSAAMDLDLVRYVLIFSSGFNWGRGYSGQNRDREEGGKKRLAAFASRWENQQRGVLVPIAACSLAERREPPRSWRPCCKGDRIGPCYSARECSQRFFLSAVNGKFHGDGINQRRSNFQCYSSKVESFDGIFLKSEPFNGMNLNFPKKLLMWGKFFN